MRIVAIAAIFCIGVVIGLMIGFEAYHCAVLPRTIDHRAQDLGLMQYSYRAGGMVTKDEDMKWTLYYLKHGTMNTNSRQGENQ